MLDGKFKALPKKKIKLEPHGDAITTTAITMVKSTLDKLKDTRVVNNEKLEAIIKLMSTPLQLY